VCVANAKTGLTGRQTDARLGLPENERHLAHSTVHRHTTATPTVRISLKRLIRVSLRMILDIGSVLEISLSIVNSSTGFRWNEKSLVYGTSWLPYAAARLQSGPADVRELQQFQAREDSAWQERRAAAPLSPPRCPGSWSRVADGARVQGERRVGGARLRLRLLQRARPGDEG
jgi:hypothetical protein